MTEAVIIADSSPLIGLARIGQLDLLPALASRVIIPPAVLEELTSARAWAPGAEEVRSAEWLEVENPSPSQVASLSILVDRGEAEALALAQHLEDSLLLVDDARARRLAEHLGLRRIGTLGILRRAKKQGLVGNLRPLFEGLQKAGIYIRQALIDAVLADVGE